MVDMQPQMLAVAHVHNGGESICSRWGFRAEEACYLHHFYTFSFTPPFQIIHVSPPFRFQPTLHNSVDTIQFCTGLAFDRGQNQFILSYGSGDCEASQVALSIAAVHDLLLGIQPSDPHINDMRFSTLATIPLIPHL